MIAPGAPFAMRRPMAKLPPALGLAWLAAVLLGSPRAHADEPAPGLRVAAGASIQPLPIPPLPPPPPKPVSHPRVIWYGWETLATGAAAYLLPLALLKNETGLVLGSVLSPLTTMSMHTLHGDVVKAYVSVPLSYAMVAGGGALAAKLECGPLSKHGCVANAVFAGMILGGLSAVVLDAATLAWGRPVNEPPVKKAMIWPSVAPLQGGATLSIGGTF
jgi:hypothetical protein